MKIISVTPEEEAVVAKLRREALKAKAGAESAEVVRAAGTSEGAKKGWEHRIVGLHQSLLDATRNLERVKWGREHIDDQKTGEHLNALENHIDNARGRASTLIDSMRVKWNRGDIKDVNRPNEATLQDVRNSLSEADEHLKYIPITEGNEVHHSALAAHIDNAIGRSSTLEDHARRVTRTSTKATDAASTDVVHCRASSVAGPKLGASQPWSTGERVEIMWMPAGTHTICAGFRKGSIELTVQCDETTASAVQASLDSWREERPKQEPFGCIEHREQEASFRVGASCGFAWRNDGVYLAAEPTKLGADNVNGRVHRSWSPSFTTDAEYSKATERDGVLVFPEGVRGSRSNPARITGVDFCVGTLTNKPAFHEIAPVKAREAGDAVTAAGTSEGVKKSWETRNHGLSADAHKATVAAYEGPAESRIELHTAAMNAHSEAAVAHSPESKMRAAHIDSAGYHGNVVAALTRGHKGDLSRSSIHDFLSKCTATDTASPDSIRAHCRLTLLQDVPDATDAEVAQYEAEVEGGGSHSDAVIKLRSARQNGFKTTGSEPGGEAVRATWSDAAREAARLSRKAHHESQGADYSNTDFSVHRAAADAHREAGDAHTAAHKVCPAGNKPYHAAQIKVHNAMANMHADMAEKYDASDATPTLDTIAAKHSAAVEAANRIAAERGAAKLTAEDVYERFAPAKEDATPEAILERIYARAGGNR